MKSFTLNKKRYQVPTAWQELSPKQLLKVCLLLHQYEEDDVLLPLFRCLCKVPDKLWDALSLSDRYELIRMVEPFTIERMLYPGKLTFRVGLTTYHLPPHELRMESSIAVAMADLHMKNFLMTPARNSHSLDLMIASLCRPLKRCQRKNDRWDGYSRERYHTVLVEQRAKRLARLDFRVKLYILRYFIASLDYLHKTYPGVYKPPIPKKGQPAPKQAPKGLGMIPWLMAIAETGAFGTFDEVCHADVHTLHIYHISRV